jgi:hypothetical protein
VKLYEIKNMDRSRFPNKQQDKSSGVRDQSPSIPTKGVDTSYINGCVEKVCLNGGSSVAYKKQIEKLYPRKEQKKQQVQSSLVVIIFDIANWRFWSYRTMDC